jgi:hypothetical protein
LNNYFHFVKDKKYVDKLLQRLLFSRLNQPFHSVKDPLFNECTKEHSQATDYTGDPCFDLLYNDFLYFKQTKEVAYSLSYQICTQLQSLILSAQNHMADGTKDSKFAIQFKGEVSLDQLFLNEDGLVIWKPFGWLQVPIKALQTSHILSPLVINENIIASCLRYHYMKMNTMGLAFCYEKLGYAKNDSVCEGFSSYINHYFDVWCSAFPDVDVESVGNFFHVQALSQQLLIINPPYDVGLCNQAFVHVKMLCKKCPNLTVMFVLPDWEDWKELTKLKQSSFLVSHISKYEAMFQDATNNKTLHPCNIVICFFGKVRNVVKHKLTFD